MKRVLRILAGFVLLVWAVFLTVHSYRALTYARRACTVALQSRELALKMIDLHDIPPKGSPEDGNLPPVPDVSHAFAGCDIWNPGP